jgi:tetratricopeptide (TPR) repeat protein
LPAIETARKHQSTPAALVRSLRGELDWITMKALEKERSRRYASTAELAADLRRYLDNQPVLAGPPSTVYRMKKFVRRHRVPVAAAGVVLLALVGGIVGVTWQAIVARRAEARATQRFNDVRAIANKLLFDFDNSIMHVPGTVKARRMLVTTALEYLDKLARDAADDVNLQNDLAMAYVGVGKIQYEPSHPNIGDTKGAIASYKKAVEIARHAVSQRPGDSRLRGTLALALARYGSTAYFFEPDAAIAACNEAIAIFEPLARASPDNRPIRVDLGAVTFSLGWAESDTGKIQEGLAHRRQALDYFEKLMKETPDDVDVARWLAACHLMLGKSLQLTGKLDEAEREMQTARKLHVEIARPDPNNAFARRSIAMADSMLAELAVERRDYSRAAELYASATDAMEALAALDPENVQARTEFAVDLHRLAWLQAKSDDVAGAIKTLENRFLPMVRKRYPPGHAGLIGYELEYAVLLRRAHRFEDEAGLLTRCEHEASAASCAKLPDVLDEQIALYEAWSKPELVAAAKARLAQLPRPTTQPAHWAATPVHNSAR